MTEKKKRKYSWRNFKWAKLRRETFKLFKKSLPLAVLFAIVLGVTLKITSGPTWEEGNVTSAELAEYNLETVEIEVIEGDSYWSIQRTLVPEDDMRVLHDIFIALNPDYNGKVIEKGKVYTFVKKKEC